MAALIPFVAWNGTVQAWNVAVYDRLLELHPPAASPIIKDIVLVALDDTNIRRSVLAAGLLRLAAAPPKVLALDLPASEESTNEDDQMLGRVLAQFPNLILGVKQRAEVEFESPPWALPIPILRGSNSLLGHVNLSPDSDGTVRTVALKQGDEEEHYWALAVQAVLLYQGGKADIVEHGDSLEIGAVNVPAMAVQDYLLWIRPAGPSGTFPTFSIHQLLDGTMAPQTTSGKIVILGMAPEIEIQASIIRALLDRDFLRTLPVEAEYILLLAWAAVGVVFGGWREGRGIVWVIAAGVLALPVIVFAALTRGVILPLVSLDASFCAAALLAGLVSLVRARRSATSTG